MKIKSKNSRRRKEAAPEIPLTPPPEAPPQFTPDDLPAGEQGERPKRSYTRRKTSGGELSGVSFGKLLVFAGDTVSKLAGLLTKQDAPLNEAEKEMLNTVGDTCGKFLIDESQLEEVAPKYAKVAVVGVLALVAGVRAIDYFTRPRLTAGKPPTIAYDVVQDDVSEHHG